MRLDASVLRPSAGWAYFLDVDGTLAEIAATPDSVTVDPKVPKVLAALADATGGAVALVSGRPIAEIDWLLAPLHLPAAGLHGLERRSADGRVTRASSGFATHGDLLARMRAFASEWPGVIVEDKGLTLALHYRGRPDAEPAARALVRRLATPFGDRAKVQEGKMVLELKPALSDKGSVVRAFMSEPPFVDRLPLFAGDDVTDEDGFAAVNAMGGHSIRIGDDTHSDARWCFDGIDAFVGWLAEAPPRPIAEAGE